MPACRVNLLVCASPLVLCVNFCGCLGNAEQVLERVSSTEGQSALKSDPSLANEVERDLANKEMFDIGAVSPPLVPSLALSLDQEMFNHITMGMTRENAETILGEPKQEYADGRGTAHYGHNPQLGKFESPYSPYSIIITYQSGVVTAKQFYPGSGSGLSRVFVD